jgi:hypothetical protein
MFPPSPPNPYTGTRGAPPTSNFTPFYQVKPNDKSLADVAGANGLDLNNLVNLNGGTKSLPPVGSYIVTHPAGLSTQAGVPASVINAYNPNVGLYAGQTPGHTPNQGYPGAPSTTTPMYTHERQKAVIDLTQQLNQGLFPPIPFNVQSGLINPETGQPYTAQDMLDNGYVANNLTGQFEHKTGANQASGVAPNGVNAQGLRLDANGNVWDPATARTDIYGGRFIQKGAVRWEHVNGKLRQVQYLGNGKKKVINKHGGKEAAAQQAPAMPNSTTNTTATASTVLSLHLGSG